MLARLLRLFPENAQAGRVIALFDKAFTKPNIADEVAYLTPRPTSRGFERPYGWAWLLMLAAELRRADQELWLDTFRPLERAFVARFEEFLPKLTYPIRAGHAWQHRVRAGARRGICARRGQCDAARSLRGAGARVVRRRPQRTRLGAERRRLSVADAHRSLVHAPPVAAG